MNKILNLIAVFSLLFNVMTSCKKEPPKVLPTISTSVSSNITSISAMSGGSITNDGGVAITARGVCWNTNQNPTISDNKTSDGTSSGSFTSSITGLTPGITYYVRAYATNIVGTAYGNQVSFTTNSVLPVLTTIDVLSVSSTTATSGGIISGDGGATVTERGLCWNTSPNPTITNNKTVNGTGIGIYTSSLTNLIPGTTYYIRAYATNASGTAYGNQIEFTTLFSTPLLTTVSVSALASISAIVSGNISHDGGKQIISSGICWSTTENPTVLDNKTMDGMAIGSFYGSLTGLYPNVTYYARAYATNSVGTQYANQISFKTPSKVTDIDGNTYNTVIIGNQTWLKENLRTTKYNDGTPISNVIDKTAWGELTIGAYVWYSNNILNKNIFGALYNWYSVDNNDATKVASNGGKNICPVGWHAPTDAEWTTLTNYLGGESGAAIKLKEIGVSNWIGPNTSATNSSGFTAIPGGYFHSLGFSGIGYFGRWWSTTEIDANSAWGKGMHYNSNDAYRNNYGKTTGFSVRCLKD